MKKALRVRGIRRKQVDEDKIALAYLMLAKQILKEAPSDLPEVTSQASEQDEEAA